MQIYNKKADFSGELQCSDPAICPAAGIPIHEGGGCSVKARKHFLKFFLDISFYLCVIPYKIIKAEEFLYKKETYRLQQILCLAVHFTATLDATAQLRLRSLSHGQVPENPRLYFNTFIIIVHTGMIITFCYSMWKSWNEFCLLVRTVQMCPIVSLWYPKKINWIMCLITMVYLIMAFLNPLFNDGGAYTWKSLFEIHARRGRYMLFVSGESVPLKWNHQLNESTKITSSTNGSNISQLPNIMFASFSYFASTSNYIVVYHADLIVNVMSLTLWCATSFFINTLRQQGCSEAITNYEALKTLSGHVNDVAGTIVLMYTVDSVLYYATNLESLFTGKNWFSKVVVLQFLISSVSWLHFASCACLKMDQFRDWIRQKDSRSVLPSKSISIMLLLDEISVNKVGLSGNGLFTINYKFVAQAVTTVMTYFILVIQFK